MWHEWGFFHNQGSPHLVKTGWLEVVVNENLWYFRKTCIYFNVSFPAHTCPPTFHKTNMLHNDLKKDQMTKFGIKYLISNQEHEYWGEKSIIGKKYYQNTDRVTKTSPFGGNRVISLTPGWKDHPLDLVWWAQTTDGCMSSFLLVHTNIYRIKQSCWRI